MRKLTGLLLLVMLSLLVSSVVFANLSGFAGNWVNTDPNTRGNTKLSIEVNGTNVMLQAWGACSPTDCDWGKVVAYPYTASVSNNQANTSDALSAIFTTGFSQTLMIVKQSGNQLKAEIFTRFTDGSGRSNYHNTYTFNRQLVLLPIGPIRTIMPIGLATPVQTSPANGSVFGHYPRTTTLKWNAVAGAASYTVEVDCLGCCGSQWCSDLGQQWKVVPNITTNYYIFDFVGAQPGRWRVWAVGSGGQQSAKSGWWEFKYTQ
jgi:hypothetical protein